MRAWALPRHRGLPTSNFIPRTGPTPRLSPTRKRIRRRKTRRTKSGNGNIRIGKGSVCISCSNNIAIGNGAFVSTLVSNSIAIGDGTIVLENNEIQIGNENTEITRLKGTVKIDPAVYYPNTAKFELCQQEFTNSIVRCNSIGFTADKSNTELAANTQQITRLETTLSERKAEAEQQQRQINQQQAQIEAQAAESRKLQEQIKSQQTQIDALKALVCATNGTAAVCQK